MAWTWARWADLAVPRGLGVTWPGKNHMDARGPQNPFIKQTHWNGPEARSGAASKDPNWKAAQELRLREGTGWKEVPWGCYWSPKRGTRGREHVRVTADDLHAGRRRHIPASRHCTPVRPVPEFPHVGVTHALCPSFRSLCPPGLEQALGKGPWETHQMHQECRGEAILGLHWHAGRGCRACRAGRGSLTLRVRACACTHVCKGSPLFSCRPESFLVCHLHWLVGHTPGSD